MKKIMKILNSKGMKIAPALSAKDKPADKAKEILIKNKPKNI